LIHLFIDSLNIIQNNFDLFIHSFTQTFIH